MKKTRFSFVSIENMSTFAAQTKKQTLQSECSAVGSALRSGRRGRAFESPHSDRRRQTSKIGCRFFFFTFTNRCKSAENLDQRKNLRDFISMHIIFVQFLIERVSDLTIAYLFYIISTFTKDIRKQSPIT